MMTNLEVRVLLVVWATDKRSIGRSALNKRFSGKTPEANKARENLMTQGAIVASADGKLFTLTDAGKALLTEALAGDEFEFSAQIGKKMANDLLQWCRSQSVSSPVVKEAVSAIESYEAFKTVALEVYDRLNKEHVHSGLVPIWQARQEIGNALSRTQFNDWIMQMQAEQIFYLQTGEALGATESQKRDSLETDIRGLLFYISQPN